MKIFDFHVGVMKIMKLCENLKIIMKKKENYITSCENHENQQNHYIPRENNENHENHKIK